MKDVADAAGAIDGRFKGRLGGFRMDAAFRVPASGVTALFGPSGSGKTTLLRCIAGLTRMHGDLRVRGAVWQDDRRFLPPHRRPIGFVFQEPSLLAHLSVRGNLLYAARRAGPGAKVGFEEAVALLGLEPLLRRSTLNLSGGEGRRVAIGRALLAGPELMLMDEPLSGLDRDAKAEILPYLERLCRGLAVPMIYVSHDPAEVARLADRVLLMRDGRIEAPAPGRASPLHAVGARDALAGLDNERVTRLALAALIAGLAPAEAGEPDSPV